jgi:photosynthetic reaction center cytochrome c subunit
MRLTATLVHFANALPSPKTTMSSKLRLVSPFLAAILMALVVASPFAGAQPLVPSKTTDQAFKNIQILKGIPSDQLFPTMQFIAASLGVECSYCHVEGAFDKDDKKTKQTARKMMEMMFAINKNNFDGRREVTCYSCHHGNSHPQGIPLIPASAETPDHTLTVHNSPVDSTAANSATNPESNPQADPQETIDPILEKYIAALGGASLLQKVTSRIEKGSADLSGKLLPIEIYTQAPDKWLSIMHTPGGDSVTGYNGTHGWLSNPGHPPQWMSSGEIDAVQLDADLALPIRMKQVFSELRMRPTEKIDGHDVIVVEGRRANKTPVNFYFDQQSGLLVRMVRYLDTAVGLNPTQIDYADYRDSGGVKIPYRWTVARPRGRFTIQLDQVQQNAAIDSQKFAAPVQPTPEQKTPAPAK